jgi:hypothetical protein
MLIIHDPSQAIWQLSRAAKHYSYMAILTCQTGNFQQTVSQTCWYQAMVILYLLYQPTKLQIFFLYTVLMSNCYFCGRK